MRIVADTSILIDHLRGGPHWKKFEKEQLNETSELYLPTIVFFELFSGSSTKLVEIETKISDFTDNFESVTLTKNIARRAGVLYRDYVKDLEMPDYIIAATALEIDASVVTLNHKHFSQIPGLKVYG